MRKYRCISQEGTNNELCIHKQLENIARTSLSYVFKKHNRDSEVRVVVIQYGEMRHPPGHIFLICVHGKRNGDFIPAEIKWSISF